MSAIRIVKGLPISFLVKVKDNNVDVNVNDGTWNVTIGLYYQTKIGPQPFTITPTDSGSYKLVALTSQQTTLLDHLGTGYVLITRASKIDDSVHIKTEVPVSVTNDL